MKNAILNYCKERNITIEELSNIVNISVAQLYLINKNSHYNVTIVTINKIWDGTEKKFGKGLAAHQYLNFKSYEK